jgi:toxin ParE1/3/4
MGRSYADIKDYLRGVPIENYIILYQVTDSGIEILRVINGYRDWSLYLHFQMN